MTDPDFFDFDNMFNAQDLKNAGLPEDIRAIIGRVFCFQAKQNPESTIYGTVTAVEFNGEGPEIHGYPLIKMTRDEAGWIAKVQIRTHDGQNFIAERRRGCFMLL